MFRRSSHGFVRCAAAAGDGGRAGASTRRPGTRTHYSDLRLHGLSFQQAGVRGRPPRLPSLCVVDHASLQRPHPVRQRAGARACARRRTRRSRRARARTGVRRFPVVAELQRARGHDAGAGRHHQRATRAAHLLRRRAAVRRYRYRPDDMVRGRRGRARRARPGVAVSGHTSCRR